MYHTWWSMTDYSWRFSFLKQKFKVLGFLLPLWELNMLFGYYKINLPLTLYHYKSGQLWIKWWKMTAKPQSHRSRQKIATDSSNGISVTIGVYEWCSQERAGRNRCQPDTYLTKCCISSILWNVIWTSIQIVVFFYDKYLLFPTEKVCKCLLIYSQLIQSTLPVLTFPHPDFYL